MDMNNGYNIWGSFFVLVETSQITKKESKSIPFYWYSQNIQHPLLPHMGGIVWPDPVSTWPIKPVDLSKSWLTAVFSLGVLDQEYLVTPSLGDVELTFLPAAGFCW